MMSVYFLLPYVNGVTPLRTPSSFVCTMRSRSSSRALRSRKAIMSRNFQVVSTCISGNGSRPG